MRILRFETFTPLQNASARPANRAATFTVPAGSQDARRAAAVFSSQPLFSTAPVGNATEKKRRGVKKGRSMLAALDALKVALLGGETTADAAGKLAEISREAEEAVDPALDEILGHIKVRAAVELAKLEYAKADSQNGQLI